MFNDSEIFKLVGKYIDNEEKLIELYQERKKTRQEILNTDFNEIVTYVKEILQIDDLLKSELSTHMRNILFVKDKKKIKLKIAPSQYSREQSDDEMDSCWACGSVSIWIESIVIEGKKITYKTCNYCGCQL